MTKYLEAIAIIPVKTIISAYPGKTSFVLDNAIDFIMR
jgi:hypothetical protein